VSAVSRLAQREPTLGQKDEVSMGHRNRSFGRTFAIAVAALSVAGTAHGQPASGAPAAKAEKAAPAAAAGDKSAKPAAGPSPIIQKGLSRANCERLAKVLAGKEKDPDLLKRAGEPVGAARAASSDLVTCMAVLADSDEPCTRLGKEEADNCRHDRATFHELRTYPNGKGFMLDERKYEECKQNAALAPVCDTVRKALRSGDPNQCVLKADFEAICRSDSGMDASKCATEAPQLKTMLEGHCRALVTLDEAACDVPGPHHEEMSRQCRADVKAGQVYGKGLKELASSGTAREKELAKAALKDPSACKALTESAVDACAEVATPPSPGPVDAPPPAPEAEAPAGEAPAAAQPPAQ
jgi:hypothetical protein